MRFAFIVSIALWIIIIAWVSWLTGCAERSMTFLPAKTKADRPAAFATLASSNDKTEMSASTVYTRLELLRARIDNALTHGYIGIVQAKSYMDQADDIQTAVDHARADKRLITIESQSRRLDALIGRLGDEISSAKQR
jgi:hypothetical protein